MKYFCTLSDWFYLPRGIALYESLLKTTKDGFKLWYLCLDDKTFKKIKSMGLQKIISVNLKELEKDQELLKAKVRMNFTNYCWTLASYFTNYLINCENLDHIVYIDSDIYFYNDIDILYQEIANKNVGIIPNRNEGGETHKVYGKYQVEVVYFKGNKIGRDVLEWWKDAVLYRKYPALNTYGDQKYLDAFVLLFGEENICTTDKLFAHPDPLSFQYHSYEHFEHEKKVVWKGIEQPLVYIHYHRLGNSWETWTTNIDKILTHHKLIKIPVVMKLYDDYFLMLKSLIKKYELEIV